MALFSAHKIGPLHRELTYQYQGPIFKTQTQYTLTSLFARVATRWQKATRHSPDRCIKFTPIKSITFHELNPRTTNKRKTLVTSWHLEWPQTAPVIYLKCPLGDQSKWGCFIPECPQFDGVLDPVLHPCTFSGIQLCLFFIMSIFSTIASRTSIQTLPHVNKLVDPMTFPEWISYQTTVL